MNKALKNKKNRVYFTIEKLDLGEFSLDAGKKMPFENLPEKDPDNIPLMFSGLFNPMSRSFYILFPES